MPRQVAVILDGNRRWAAQKGLPVAVWHHAGGQKLAELVSFSMDWGVKVVSVFAFSTENWRRPKEEVDFLMKLFEDLFNTDPDWYASKGVQVRVIGDKSGLPKNLQVTIEKAEQLTKANSSFQLICAINYSGKYDITQACKSIAEKIKDGLMEPEDINKDLFEQHLLTNGTQFPEPDLLIRTSGEHRVSNFMLWQLAYSELVFIDKLWPDFAKEDYVEALKHFQKRERRYGGRPL
ncbi:Dimethylallylcistransferase [Bertholletia excelsa]